MTSHVHIWTPLSLRGRYHCECGVIGHKPLRGPIAPYTCQQELAGRKHCGADAIHVTGERIKNRCAEHAPPGTSPSHNSQRSTSAPTPTQPSTGCSTTSSAGTNDSLRTA